MKFKQLVFGVVLFIVAFFSLSYGLENGPGLMFGAYGVGIAVVIMIDAAEPSENEKGVPYERGGPIRGSGESA